MFKKAERKKIKLKIAISGPSGSGKTYSALRLASGISKKIAVIDTENGSASLYSDKFNFDVHEIKPPYTIEKYINAIFGAVEAGFEVLIVDSISHQWRGDGGILSKKEQLDSRGGNSFTNWAKLTPEQEKFLSAILHSGIHLISTMRSKQEYAMQVDDKGKSKVQKLGLAPIQRDGVEYEFTTVFDVAMNHEAEASKDRTGLFAGRMFQITEQTGKEFVNWLNDAKEADPTEPVVSYSNPEILPEDYEPTFGKFKGKKLKSLEIYELKNYVEYIHAEAKHEGKEIRGQVKEFVANAEKYIKSALQNEPPALDKAENL